jgi:hypothetical protein
MNSRNRIRAIVAGKPADRCGLWLGNPHADTWPLLHKFFGTSTEEELRQKLNDDLRWIPAGPLSFTIQQISLVHAGACPRMLKAGIRWRIKESCPLFWRVSEQYRPFLQLK